MRPYEPAASRDRPAHGQCGMACHGISRALCIHFDVVFVALSDVVKRDVKVFFFVPVAIVHADERPIMMAAN